MAVEEQYDPAGQLVHTSAEIRENFPSVQLPEHESEVSPVVAPNVPALQFEHEDFEESE